MKVKPRKIIGQKVYYQCNVCKSWFEKNGFYSDNRSKTGITSSCKHVTRKPQYQQGIKNWQRKETR